MLKVGFIGWRGMVGSVLMARMRAENDFEGLEPEFFSTSSPGRDGPEVGSVRRPLLDAHDIATLGRFDVLLSCQGGAYTKEVFPKLRNGGWNGVWIDAASALRMNDDVVLVLDPVNRPVIEAGLAQGLKTYCGANCTTSLMLMALVGLYRAGLVEWISTMTYQAASGAGARQMVELVRQMGALADAVGARLHDPAADAIEIDRAVTDGLRSPQLPADELGHPLAASLLPWIDRAVEDGQTREEWKSFVESNKILGTETPIPVDGQCVRVGAMRCHSQAFTIKLTRDVPADDVAALIAEAHPWARVIDNRQAPSLAHLTPTAVTGTLDVPVGRIRKMKMGPAYLTAFSVGDQLLWGAAEPLRRMLRIYREHVGQ